MMKVYDMVTYAVCEPEDNARSSHPKAARVADGTQVPATGRQRELQLGLQPIEYAPPSPRHYPMPPLHGTELSGFLATLGD
jgi:hypothetical protein